MNQTHRLLLAKMRYDFEVQNIVAPAPVRRLEAPLLATGWVVSRENVTRLDVTHVETSAGNQLVCGTSELSGKPMRTTPELVYSSQDEAVAAYEAQLRVRYHGVADQVNLFTRRAEPALALEACGYSLDTAARTGLVGEYHASRARYHELSTPISAPA